MSTLIRAKERKKCTELGIQPVHFQVLNYLSRCNKYSNTPAAVANYLGMTRGTVSQSLIILEKYGYLEKTPDANDRRVVNLKLLPAGLNVLEQARLDKLFDAASGILINGGAHPANPDVFQQALTALQTANDSHSFGVCKTCRNFQVQDGEYFCQFTQETLASHESEQICQEHGPV